MNTAPQPWLTYSENDTASAPLGGNGSATTLPVMPADDVIERLHRVVEEVTRKPVAPPTPRRIGFL